jgi:ATP-dependent helicase/nuclease subunit B
MEVLAGLELGGASLTALDDLETRGRVGALVCGPRQLLRDLELRLGRGANVDAEGIRIACWQARVARLSGEGRFYSRSFTLDPLATARILLSWRDGLVEAGWSGAAIAAGGPRLHALAELEVLSDSALPDGHADRLRDVALAISQRPRHIYDQLLLSEAPSQWGALWERIFGALGAGGTRVSSYEPRLPGAPPASDLGKIQAALSNAAAAPSSAPVHFEADGSFVILSAETSWAAARATAAICSGWELEHTVLIRQQDASALEHAFEAQRCPTQGWAPRSPWRAALQVLPLALELAFEPKDPARVLELLTLPGGPFAGSTGRRLARALSRSPGVGSPDWQRETALLAQAGNPEAGEIDSGQQTLRERIETWLEQPGAPAAAGAPLSSLIAVIERVHAWLLTQIRRSPDDGLLLAAAHQAATLRAALQRESRPTLDLLSVRRKLESVLGSGTAARVLPEQCARLEHVDRAEALSVPRKNVIWWFFGDAAHALARPPWNRRERLALQAAGLRFADPAERVMTRALQRRRALFAATERVILVMPRSSRGQPVSVDPLWDEILARAIRSNTAQLRALQCDARDLLSPDFETPLLPALKRALISTANLPGGQLEWTLGAGLPRHGHYSASSLDALLGCPLKWALGYSAGLRASGHALPAQHQLNGTLGHRLIEILHGEHAFELDRDALQQDALPQDALAQRARSALDELIQREGAVLLQPGASFELSQLREQLVAAVIELARLLREHGASIDAVERSFDVPWRGGRLEGRLDLLLRAPDGTPSIIDLKWGASSYRAALANGQALQLALYAVTQAHHAADGGLGAPGAALDAAYFSLKAGRLLALATSPWRDAERIQGRGLGDTWSRIERSMDRAEHAIAQGRFPVTGLRRSLPLLDSFGVHRDAHQQFYSAKPEDACKYCEFDAVCGRRWETSDAD